MRLVFAGTPAVAVPSLLALLDAGHEIVAVLTRPDAPVGRKRIMTPSPVAQVAMERDLPLVRATKVDDSVVETLSAFGPDLGVAVAYGALLSRRALDVPARGWINLHFSDLPHWRGAAPAQRTILSGASEAALSVFQLDEGMDTGPVYDRAYFPIAPEETSGELLARLAVLGAPVLANTVARLSEGRAQPVPQAGEATLAPKFAPEEGHISGRESAVATSARIRAVTPEPGAYVVIAGQRMKLLRTHVPTDDLQHVAVPAGHIRAEGGTVLLGTSTVPLVLDLVQPSGKKAMAAPDWFRGLRAPDGVVVDA
jgi:methionyl-tRNA formyltransferase